MKPRLPGHPAQPVAFDPHLYDWHDVLRPQGGLKQKSISLDVFDAMVAAYAYWVDSEYSDNPDPAELRAKLIENARSEVELAVAEFVKRFGGPEPRTNQNGD